MPSRISRHALIASLSTAVAAPAAADPTIGIGLTVTFGGGQPQVGAGVRVFSDDEEDEFAASLGLDYLFTSGSFRPSIGAAYLMNNSYIGLDAGYNLSGGNLDFGASAGIADTDDDDGPGLAGGGGGGGEGEGGTGGEGGIGGEGGTGGEGEGEGDF